MHAPLSSYWCSTQAKTTRLLPVDSQHMGRCLELAQGTWGQTWPNPMVGAVVANAQGQTVAEGFHAGAGYPHAEVIALNKAGAAVEGGTLYCNLEPCNHTGRTPPCTERIIAAGPARVVIGAYDPNPQAAGGTIRLKNAGIVVQLVDNALLQAECLTLNAPFFHWAKTKQPYIALKLALTRDGRMADKDQGSQWITGPIARKMGHQLRSRYQAILVSAKTVAADNPLLTVRDTVGTDGRSPVQPLRLVIDRRFSLDPSQYQLFQTALEEGCSPVWVFTSRQFHNATHAQQARAMGVRVVLIDELAGPNSGLDLTQLMHWLGSQSVVSVLAEAGGVLSGALVQAGLVQKAYWFYGAGTLGSGTSACQTAMPLPLAQAHAWHTVGHYPLGDDLLVEADWLGPENQNKNQNSLGLTHGR